MGEKEQLVIEKLDVLAGLENALAHWRAEKERAIDKAIPQEVKDKLAGIDIEFDAQIHVANVNIASITADVKAMALPLGHSVKGRKKQAVWNKGQGKWDNKGLWRYAEKHAEILPLYNEGEPYVSIKEVKQ